MFNRPVVKIKVSPSRFIKIFVVFTLLSGIVNAFAVPYAINSWLLYFGKSAVVTWWHGFLVGIIPVIGEMTVIIAVLTWVIMLFLI